MTALDRDNPIVRLCVAGMRAEGEGRLDAARDLFTQAWAARRDDFEACVAAHYVARHQDKPEETLRWNEVALKQAQAVGDERVQGFFASLYLNLGHAHEMLGHAAEARRFYDRAAAELDKAPGGRYGDMVRSGIESGRARAADQSSQN
jgi:hypothetical protein